MNNTAIYRMQQSEENMVLFVLLMFKLSDAIRTNSTYKTPAGFLILQEALEKFLPFVYD